MTTPTPEQQREERLEKLRQALHAEPERMAGFTDRHAELSRLIARLQVKLELGDDVKGQLAAALEERSDLAVDISLNGRRAQALQAELSEAETAVAHARMQAAAEARARWEPRLREKLPEIERAAIAAVEQLVAARSLLDGTPAGFIDAHVLIRKLTYYEGTASIERIKDGFVADQGSGEQEQPAQERRGRAQPPKPVLQSKPAPRRVREPGDFDDGPMP